MCFSSSNSPERVLETNRKSLINIYTCQTSIFVKASRVWFNPVKMKKSTLPCTHTAQHSPCWMQKKIFFVHTIPRSYTNSLKNHILYVYTNFKFTIHHNTYISFIYYKIHHNWHVYKLSKTILDINVILTSL